MSWSVAQARMFRKQNKSKPISHATVAMISCIPGINAKSRILISSPFPVAVAWLLMWKSLKPDK